jgi:hypothetical protein
VGGILTLLITFNKWCLQIGQSNWAKIRIIGNFFPAKVNWYINTSHYSTFNKWRLQIGQSNWAKMTNATPTGLNIQIRICLDPLIFDLLGPEPDLGVKIAPQF